MPHTQPRGTGHAGPGNDKVANLRFVDYVVETQAIGDFRIARIPEHHVALPNDNGHVGERHVEVIQHILHSIVAIEVHRRVGMTVTR